jgi:SAM-dependent methyltransferase
MTPGSPLYRWHRLQQALRRRQWRSRIDGLYEQLVATCDRDAFRERFRPYWDPFAGTQPAKFLDVETWLREAVFRYLLIGGDKCEAGRVLDIGAGTGYFLLVCQQAGHEVLGLDVPGEPLYDACFEFFGLPRVLHRIEPGRPLPELGEPFDLITAFMTCFNYDVEGRPWEAPRWVGLLSELRERLRDGGRLVIKFNREPASGRFYSPEVQRVLRRAAGFRTRFFLDYAMMQAR